MKFFTAAFVLALGPGPLLSAAPSSPALPYCPQAVVPVDGLKGKFLFGYQGWFGYPGDGSKNNAWFHWFGMRDGKRRIYVDMLPDLSEYGDDELADGDLLHRDGKPVKVYSAHNPKTVDRHFKWMKDYNLDGIFLQRFSKEMAESEALRDFRDQVTRNVMASAEKHGRVFAIMYDVSGDPNAAGNLKKDWAHLVELGVDRHPRYLKLNGRPLVSVWGLGFNHNPATVEQAEDLVAWFKDTAKVSIKGGVPTGWRTLSGDSLPQAAWAKIYRSFDVISPWSINRYQDLRGADRFLRRYLAPDLAEARRAGREYMPVVFPGYSAHNLSWGAQPLNEVRRMGGTFLWRQVYNALQSGAATLYGAMFDEVDEGTAFYKVVAGSAGLPTEGAFVAHDSDGYPLPNDWYLKLAGVANMALKGKFKAGPLMPLDIAHPGRSEGCFNCGQAALRRGQGGVISVDFTGGGRQVPGPMAPSEIAGAQPAGFWNNAEFEAGTLKGLLDDSGKATQATLAWAASGIWSTPIKEQAGDSRMMKGYLDAVEGATVTVKVSGLPPALAKGFKVIAYTDGDDSEAERHAVFSIGQQSEEAVDAPGDFFGGTFVESQGGQAGNYVVFDGLKGTSFELRGLPGMSTGKWRRCPLNGLQVIRLEQELKK